MTHNKVVDTYSSNLTKSLFIDISIISDCYDISLCIIQYHVTHLKQYSHAVMVDSILSATSCDQLLCLWGSGNHSSINLTIFDSGKFKKLDYSWNHESIKSIKLRRASRLLYIFSTWSLRTLYYSISNYLCSYTSPCSK